MTDSKPDQVNHQARRQFLREATGAGALGAVAVLFGKGAAAEAAALAAPPAADLAGGGYRETAHIRNYYRSARYW